MSIVIKADIKPFKYEVEMLIKRHSVKNGSYGVMDEKTIERVKKHIINQFPDITLPDVLIIAIRSAYTREKIMLRHGKLKRSVKYLYSLFKSGYKIEQIARKYDYSPLSVARQFLLLNVNPKDKVGKKTIKTILRNPDKIKNERMSKEVKNIIERGVDIFASVDNENAAAKAEDFEGELGEYLTSRGVKYKTQEELVEEQIKTHGKPINTPDFLILSDLTINGVGIKWIDAKNFFGANAWMIRKSIQKQTKKYIDNWGQGAIVFSLGFSEKLEVADEVMMVGYNALTSRKITSDR